MEIDKEKVRKLFERYDKNKNDTLEKKEFIAGFKEMLIQMGEYMPEKKHEQVAMEGIREFDLNGNGCLEFDEFEKLVEFLVLEKGYPLKQKNLFC